MPTVHLLDTGAGNILSVINALKKLGNQVVFIQDTADLDQATHVIFPGVGNFGPSMEKLASTGLIEPLKAYIASGRPFMGICVGMQALVESSEESPDAKGLGIIPATCVKFNDSDKVVPQMGWNSVSVVDSDEELVNHAGPGSKYYFVHSYGIRYTNDVSDELKKWVHTLTTYGEETFISSVRKGNVFATQFHPEKSGLEGLKVINSFLECSGPSVPRVLSTDFVLPKSGFVNRIIACLDKGDLVVTKGDQYDVGESSGNGIRNMGKPIELAERYFNEGADELTFLNITSYKSMPLHDLPLLDLLMETSRRVFVPLTVGGGIRALDMPDGMRISALDVAQEYFKSGADKVSIGMFLVGLFLGSDAVYSSEAYLKRGCVTDGSSSIEEISQAYGAQAVVVSIDPRRVYVKSPEDAPTHTCIKTEAPGPDGQQFCWYECTVKGGREARDLDVVQLATSVQALGAGEILLNCMDRDGSNAGYDLELLKMVRANVRIPVIASSGAGNVVHFAQALEAALAAGIFHRNEVEIKDVKAYLASRDFNVRV